MGMERLVLMLEDNDKETGPAASADVYVISAGEGALQAALTAVEALRGYMPATRIVQHMGGGSFKSQLKKADKSGAALALIWGEDEVASGSVTLKPLRESGGERREQRTVPVDQLQASLESVLAEDSK
jgi:histidyl-tRNA synthetase